MPRVTPEFVRSLGRLRGQANITVLEMARQTGISRWTLGNILDGRSTVIRTGTMDKLNQWLYTHA